MKGKLSALHIPASPGLVLSFEHPDRIKSPLLHEGIDRNGPSRARADDSNAFGLHLRGSYHCNSVEEHNPLGDCQYVQPGLLKYSVQP